jgi:hypothetical protein
MQENQNGFSADVSSISILLKNKVEQIRANGKGRIHRDFY